MACPAISGAECIGKNINKNNASYATSNALWLDPEKYLLLELKVSGMLRSLNWLHCEV